MRLVRFLLLLSLIGGPAGTVSGGTFEQRRAILDGDVDQWTNRDEIDRRLHRIKEAGFNVYMPAVWYGRGTTWPSRHAPWDFTLKTRSIPEDPLGYAIAKAHELGLEVHPWFTLTLRWNDAFMPEYGLEGVKEGPHAAFDVHNTMFLEFITRLVAEVASNYPVDGINLDFARAMGLCLSAACQQDYHDRYGRTLLLDSAAFKVNPAGVPSLIAYQEQAVRAMIQSISRAVRRSKPAIVISVDGHPDLTRYEQGQDCVAWANDGLVDVVFQMDYHPVPNLAAAEKVRARMKNPRALEFMISNMAHGADLPPGERPYARSGKWLTDTLAAISAGRPDSGIAVYFYKYLSDDQIAALKNGSFRQRTVPAATSQEHR